MCLLFFIFFNPTDCWSSYFTFNLVLCCFNWRIQIQRSLEVALLCGFIHFFKIQIAAIFGFWKVIYHIWQTCGWLTPFLTYLVTLLRLYSFVLCACSQNRVFWLAVVKSEATGGHLTLPPCKESFVRIIFWNRFIVQNKVQFKLNSHFQCVYFALPRICSKIMDWKSWTDLQRRPFWNLFTLASNRFWHVSTLPDRVIY